MHLLPKQISFIVYVSTDITQVTKHTHYIIIT